MDRLPLNTLWIPILLGSFGLAATSGLEEAQAWVLRTPVALTKSLLVSSPLQQGETSTEGLGSRFNGFTSARETVETVKPISAPSFPPLKQGVNEMGNRRATVLQRGVNESRPAGVVENDGTSRQAAVDHAEIYRRTTNEFAEAIFLKPKGTNTEDLTFRLAPLILQEVIRATNSAPYPEGSRPSSPSNDNLSVVSVRPVVYTHTDVVVIKGRPHARLAYLWPSLAESLTNSQPRPPQGVRLTLNSSGEPVIWEVLADSAGLNLIFVSQSLESAARAEFGPPLQGRRHAIEVPLEQARDVIVARVLDDGPLPMGPMVYLKTPGNDVLALICRCMPAQAKKLLRTVEYELRAWTGAAFSQQRTAFWPGRPDRPLEEQLRLPAKF